MTAGYRSSDFRRSVQNDTKKKPGGFNKRAFYEKIWLEKEHVLPMLLVPGAYKDLNPNPRPEDLVLDLATNTMVVKSTPYYKFQKHKRKIFKNGKERFIEEVCSAGPDQHNPQPCAPCAASDAGDKSITTYDGFAITIVHLAYYHGHPMVDRQSGGFIQKQQDRSLVIVYDECEGRTCNFCRVLQGHPPVLEQGETWPQYPQGTISTIFGRRRYMDVGKNHLQDILGWNDTLGKLCGNCRSEVIVDGFTCDFCKNMVIDLSTDTRSEEDIRKLIANPHPCMQCGRHTMLQEVVGCQTCESQGRTVRPIGVFNTVVFGTKQGEGTGSHLTLGPRQFATLEEFGRTIDPGFFGGKTFEQYITELAVPYEFDKLLAPHTPAEQAKNMELAGPQQGGPAQGQWPAPGQGYAQPPPVGAYPPPQQPAGYPPPQYPAPAPYAPAPAAAPAPGFPPPPRGPNFS
jgi:hypothetical protein